MLVVLGKGGNLRVMMSHNADMLREVHANLFVGVYVSNLPMARIVFETKLGKHTHAL